MPYNFKTQRHERKDYASDYAAMQCADWLSDLDSLFYPLQKAILTAFQTGDSIEADCKRALDQFGVVALSYAERGVELGMGDYLQPDDDGAMPVMYLSAADNPGLHPDMKAGRAISSSNHTKLSQAADGIASHARAIKAVLARAAGGNVYPTSADSAAPRYPAKDDAQLEALLADLALDLTIQNAVRGL
jgi:hypothetical protein